MSPEIFETIVKLQPAGTLAQPSITANLTQIPDVDERRKK
jgi:hypothetical protein